MKAPPLLRALRPQQWVKNLFVLAALVFGRGAREDWSQGDLRDVKSTLLALLAFCFASSAVYLLNDLVDVEKDRAHPEKRKRPIASGELSLPAGRAAAVASLALGFLFGGLAGGEPVGVVWVLAGYIALNLAYSLRLKHVVLVDAFCIAGGFLLRVLAGGLAAGLTVSHWLLLCTLFLALFLALCKRRAETDLLGEDRADHRAILQEYTGPYLDQMVTVLAACTILCYAMYTVSDETIAKFGGDQLVWTVPFVVFGLGRYLLLVQTQRGGGSPTRVLLGGDLVFLANCVAWAAMVVLLIYRNR